MREAKGGQRSPFLVVPTDCLGEMEVELNERTGEEVVGSAISSRGGVGDGLQSRPGALHRVYLSFVPLSGYVPLHEST